MGSDEVDQAMAEEARNLYVAGTRAIELLLLLRGTREAAWLCAKPRRQDGPTRIS